MTSFFLSVILKAFRLYILKQYFVPILMCCWKTLRKYALTFNSSLNERVMDCSTGGKSVSIWQVSNNWRPQMRWKNDWQHTLDYPLTVYFPHYRIYAHWEGSVVKFALPLPVLYLFCGQKRPSVSSEVNLAPFTSTTFTLKEKKWS